MLNLIHKKEKSRKNGEEDGKALYKLRNNAIYGQNEKMKRQNRCKACNQQKKLIKLDIQILCHIICHIKYLVMI